MAMNLRSFRRLNISLANNVLFKPNFINVGVRCIYSEQDLGVPTYESARFIFRNQFMTIEDTFRTKMKEICEKEGGVIYTEDLKAMLHLAQESEDDMELLNKMLSIYVKGKEERKVSVYAFGPVIMRMYYYLDQPKRALALFENEEFAENFDYRASFRILMCLLFKHNMFKEMRDVYEKVVSMKGMDYIGRNSVLMYAGCLKENTPESLEYALKRWKEEFQVLKPTVRSSSLMSLLAIKNNAAEIALEILAVVDRDLSITIRCLKVLAYMSLQRYIQIIPILKQSIEYSDSTNRQQKFFADVIYELEEKLKTEDIPESSKLMQLIEQLKKYELLETQFTLEEFLLRPVTVLKKEKIGQKSQPRTRARQEPRSQKQVSGGLHSYF